MSEIPNYLILTFSKWEFSFQNNIFHSKELAYLRYMNLGEVLGFTVESKPIIILIINDFSISVF